MKRIFSHTISKGGNEWGLEVGLLLKHCGGCLTPSERGVLGQVPNGNGNRR